MSIADMDFITDILTRIDQNQEDDGWDKPAQLYSLHVEGIADGWSAIKVAEFPGFDIAMRCHGHSYHALETMASLLEKVARLNAAGHDLPTPPDMGGLFALALADEAFMVKQEPSEPRPEGNFRDIPGSVEHRFVLLVAADLSTRFMIHERATGNVTQDGEWRDGRLVKAMLRLLGTALPEEQS